MDANQLHEYYKKMLIDCEAHIDSDGNSSPVYMDELMTFEILEDGYLRVTYNVMDDRSVASFQVRQYAYDNPAYYWMDGAYLVCAMRECNWKMMAYSDFPAHYMHHDLHNGRGVQIFFKKADG